MAVKIRKNDVMEAVKFIDSLCGKPDDYIFFVEDNIFLVNTGPTFAFATIPIIGKMNKDQVFVIEAEILRHFKSMPNELNLSFGENALSFKAKQFNMQVYVALPSPSLEKERVIPKFSKDNLLKLTSKQIVILADIVKRFADVPIAYLTDIVTISSQKDNLVLSCVSSFCAFEVSVADFNPPKEFSLSLAKQQIRSAFSLLSTDIRIFLKEDGIYLEEKERNKGALLPFVEAETVSEEIVKKALDQKNYTGSITFKLKDLSEALSRFDVLDEGNNLVKFSVKENYCILSLSSSYGKSKGKISLVGKKNLNDVSSFSMSCSVISSICSLFSSAGLGDDITIFISESLFLVKAKKSGLQVKVSSALQLEE